MGTTIYRRIEFDSGHRVLDHETKCKNVHGHRYAADIEVSAENLDSLGRVIDFGAIKQLVGKWIDDNWDHAYIHHPNDYIAKSLKSHDPPLKSYDLKCNPTAELMAEYLYDVSVRLLSSSGIKVVSITLWETPNCRAIYRR
jgi:6-pyruvoyltetrahydropterin/6-carboxytetrahydropterin synthase